VHLLVLGGTVFLGRHLVDAALALGHEVTLFNRGQSGADLYPQCERLTGDRDGDLAALRGRRFDAVVDTCGYLPHQVESSARLLAECVERYVFVSSGSVYAEPISAGITESSPVDGLADHSPTELTGEAYGALKALCEQAAEEQLPGRVLNVRAGLIVGPHDVSERYTYWPRRLAAGGEVLAPAPSGRPVQYIDARDLAGWILTSLERGTAGVFNVVGPEDGHDFEALVAACRTSGRDEATVTWVDEEFLFEQGVGPWMELPLWLRPENDGLMRMDCSLARAAGLTCRPPAQTAADTLAWDAGRSDERGVCVSKMTGTSMRVGLAPDREAQLLAAWHAQHVGQ
jgi:2'-hydroxyisoflavone reductase